jgi:nitroreductase
MNKPATTSLNILDEIKNRWSPRAFNEKTVETDKLERIFEAARWSASSFNEQPWRFLVGIKNQGKSWDNIFESMSKWNQTWCKSVPVLVLLVTKKTFSHNNKFNAWASYDLGQTAAYISIQAMAEGLYVHQMAGFDQDKVRNTLSIPDDFEIKTVIAIGYYGDANRLPQDIRKSELSTRSRKELSKIVFSNKWDEQAEFLR